MKTKPLKLQTKLREDSLERESFSFSFAVAKVQQILETASTFHIFF